MASKALSGMFYKASGTDYMVDAKVYEIKKKFGFDEGKIKKYLIDTGQKGVK